MVSWSGGVVCTGRKKELSGEAHHVEGFLLIKEYDGPFLVFGVDEIDEELDIEIGRASCRERVFRRV